MSAPTTVSKTTALETQTYTFFPSPQERSIPTALFTNIILPFLDLQSFSTCLSVNRHIRMIVADAQKDRAASTWEVLVAYMKHRGYSVNLLLDPTFVQTFPLTLHLSLSHFEESMNDPFFYKGFAVLLRRFPKLRSISITSMQLTGELMLALTNLGLQKISLECPGGYFRISLTEKNLQALIPGWADLRSLNLRGFDLPQNFATLIKTHCQYIEEVAVDSAIDDFGKILTCVHLRRISVDSTIAENSTITYRFFSFLPRNGSQIEHVSVFSYSITDRSLTLLKERCPRLKSLHLGYGKVTENGICELLAKCSHLEEIRLFGGSSYSKEIVITDKTLEHLARHCPKLRLLYIPASNYLINLVTDEGIAMLVKCCPDLRVVVVGSKKITDESIYLLLRHSPQIKVLELGGTAITDKPLAQLATRWSLLSLGLHSPLITEVGFAHISKCKSLHWLILSCPHINDRHLHLLGRNLSLLKHALFNGSTHISKRAARCFAFQCSQLQRFDSRHHYFAGTTLDNIRSSEERRNSRIQTVKTIGQYLLFSGAGYLTEGLSGVVKASAMLFLYNKTAENNFGISKNLSL